LSRPLSLLADPRMGDWQIPLARSSVAQAPSDRGRHLAPVIEVLIGLLLVYTILSIITSAIHEGLAGLFGWRSTYLEKGIKSLLGATLSGEFFEHDLIRALRSDAKFGFNKKPSYVSASTFTETVLDGLRKLQPPSGANPPTSPPGVPTDDVVLKDWRDHLTTQATSSAEKPAEKAERPAPIFNAVRVFANAAKDLEDFKKRLDAWYEETMDRVRGWYTRFTRAILFAIGILLVLFLNADSINIATTLWRDAPIRTAVVEQAGTVAQGEQPDTDQAVDQLRGLEQLDLPLGWVTGEGGETDPRGLPSKPVEYLIKLLGLLITAFALSFGSTFWFDLLKRFVGIRSAGPEPQPAQTGPPSGAAEKPQRLEIVGAQPAPQGRSGDD
jgi:hypothetical protein